MQVAMRVGPQYGSRIGQDQVHTHVRSYFSVPVTNALEVVETEFQCILVVRATKEKESIRGRG